MFIYCFCFILFYIRVKEANFTQSNAYESNNDYCCYRKLLSPLRILIAMWERFIASVRVLRNCKPSRRRERSRNNWEISRSNWKHSRRICSTTTISCRHCTKPKIIISLSSSRLDGANLCISIALGINFLHRVGRARNDTSIRLRLHIALLFFFCFFYFSFENINFSCDPGSWKTKYSANSDILNISPRHVTQKSVKDPEDVSHLLSRCLHYKFWL